VTEEAPERQYSQDPEAIAARRRGPDGLTKNERYRKKLLEKKAAALAAGLPVPQAQLNIEEQDRRNRARSLAREEAKPYTERYPDRVARLTKAAETKELSIRELLSMVNQRIAVGMEALDPETIAAMTGRELAILLGILTDKKLLLEGRPTAILSIEDRSSLGRLTKMWLQQAQRRGLQIEETAVDVTGQ